jgi:hypothetical protein
VAQPRQRRATLRSALTHPRGLLASTQGGAQKLPNGNYRVYRFPWSGRPARPPALVAHRRGTRVAARVSWNGATGVTGWELWAGPSPDALTRVKATPNAGFETAVSAPTDARYVALKALDASGVVIGASAAIRPVPDG